MTGLQNTTMSQQEATELESVELLTSMMGANFDSEVAGAYCTNATATSKRRRGKLVSVLKARQSTHPSGKKLETAAPAVVFRTNDEDDFSRAMEASTHPPEATRFSPSDRTPSSDWAMVPSNVGLFVLGLVVSCPIFIHVRAGRHGPRLA